MIAKNLAYVIAAWVVVAVIAFAASAFGAMSSIQHATSAAYTLQNYSASQKVTFPGIAGHVPHYRDYFRLFAAGSEVRLQWCYLDGSTGPKEVPTRLLKTGACTFEGLKPGNYAARIYAAGGSTIIDSTLFTVPPQTIEYRAVPADGKVTIERVKVNALTDMVTIKRSGHPNVETITLPTAATITQAGQTVATAAAVTKKAATPGGVRARSVISP